MKCSSVRFLRHVEFIRDIKLLMKALQYFVCFELYWKHLIRVNSSQQKTMLRLRRNGIMYFISSKKINIIS